MTKIHRACDLDASPAFAVGDPAPDGYLDWHAWADVQHKGGLRQAKCPVCGLWRFEQEKCDHKGSTDAITVAEKEE